jgi:hypothetical protein
MNIEEQLSWFSESGSRLDVALEANTKELRDLKGIVRRLGQGQEKVATTLQLVAKGAGAEFVAPLPSQDQLAAISFEAQSGVKPPLSALVSASLFLAFHRLICADYPSRIVGKFRTGRVRVGQASDYVKCCVRDIRPANAARLDRAYPQAWSGS